MHRPKFGMGRLTAGLVLTAAAGLSAAAPVVSAHAATNGDAGATYLVLYKGANTPSDAAATITAAGGTVVANYAQIGVVVAKSASSSFAAAVASDSRVDGAVATAKYATQTKDAYAGSDTTATPNAPASDSDTLSPLQWDMRQIKSPQAHAVTGGSPDVLVGDIDTGVDFNHPDLKQNLDVADSVNCLSGAPVPGLAAQDDNGHGTHTAGTIAAAANGFGIVGVAPNVRLAAIKSGDADGFFFPQAVVCAFVWAGTHHMQVTNNSYFADPYQFNCKNDPTQRAIWKAEQRAIRFAMQMGTTVVAAEGNESQDLSHPSIDPLSPDNSTPVTRDVTNACVVIPVEISGVVGVTADGNAKQDGGGYLKSFYSSYGTSTADVVAPGGDSLFGKTAEAPNGRVLSTWPPYEPCRRSVQEPTSDPSEPTAVYCYLQGTSMASPHVAGVAALVQSQHPTWPPGAVQATLTQTADPQPCPSSLPPGYLDFTQAEGFSPLPQSCQGGTGHNSWYGNGQVDALTAVLK